MNPVARFESFVERLMERTLTRTTHSRLQPIEIAKRLGRVMDADQVVGPMGIRVPNIFDVELNPADYEKFKPVRASVTQEIETYLGKVARDRRFVLASPPVVRLHSSGELRAGEVGVRAVMEDIQPAQMPSAGPPSASNGAQYTQVMPAVSAPAAAPRRHAARITGPEFSYRLEAAPVTIGRAPDNDIVFEDRRVSRRHARLERDGAHWTVHDEGSKNGTAINGKLVDEAPLHEGDRISFGGFEVTFQE